MATTFRSAGKVAHTLVFDGWFVITTAFLIVKTVLSVTDPQGPQDHQWYK